MPTLEELPVGSRARVERLDGGLGFRQHVEDLGMALGQVVRKVEHAGSGPILVEFGSRVVAVGRGLASRIIVGVLPDGPDPGSA